MLRLILVCNFWVVPNENTDMQKAYPENMTVKLASLFVLFGHLSFDLTSDLMFYHPFVRTLFSRPLSVEKSGL